ncbi:MAG: dipicolinate synthase subunit B [Bacillota bacterium]|nr:dipicolinate synthase subunit B [Bacillota bacterium]
MILKNKRVGLALTGSHCNLAAVMPVLADLVARGADVLPVLSEAVATTDTKFGLASEWIEQVRSLTGRSPILTITGAEPIGPQGLLDVLVICPCTGNTLAKLAGAITDGVVTMAAKAHLRNGRPVVVAVSTNDGLGLNAKNLGLLLAVRNVYFVPFGQDNPEAKPNSIIADFGQVAATVEAALEGRQIQPLLLGRA